MEKESYPSIKPEVIEDVVAMEGSQRAVFMENYQASNDVVRKFRLARDLIVDGRFADPQDLLDNFGHLDTPLRERLHFLLIQKGVLSPVSMSPEISERFFQDELNKRHDYRDWIDEGWPIEVVGQLMTVDLFTDISDEKKLEEYRAWTTRGILREYLGILSGKRARKEEMTVIDMLARMPQHIFTDPHGVKSHIVLHYIEQRLMRSVTDAGLQEGLAGIEAVIKGTVDGNKKEFLQRLTDRFYEIATHPMKGEFKNTVTLKDQGKPFPSFEQRTFCYDFMRHKTRLLCAETGLGKTGAAYLAMENSEANRILVIAPAGGKATWMIEENKLFTRSGNVMIVNGSHDIDRALSSGKKYIVVSQELLGLTEYEPGLQPKLNRLVQEGGIDGVIIDEIDNLHNPRAISVQTTIKLIDLVRQNFELFHHKSRNETPMMGLTATPIRSRLSDLNVAMGLLYPHVYALSYGESTPTKKTFSDSHLNRPDLVYLTLIGEKKMFRWEQATGVQEFTFETIPVEASPFEEYLYVFIANNVPTNQLNKIRILEDCLFNPLLVKSEVRKLVKGKIPLFDIDETMSRLSKVVSEWKTVGRDDFLSADRLVELGLGDLVLACFFSDLLENGIDTLVDELTRNSQDPHFKDIRRFWKQREISTKYTMLREMIEESLTWKDGPDGTLVRQKVFVVSPSRKQGRTGNVLQDNLFQYELDTINDSTLIKHLQEWVKTSGKGENILFLDGSVPIGRRRDSVIAQWVNNPQIPVLIVTLEAAYQSRDFTLKVIEDFYGRRISGVNKILLTPPWNFQQLKQMGGRSQRQGQLVPVDIKVFQSEGLIDQGKGDVVLYTYLLSRMALAGIILTPEEQAFFDSKRLGKKIPLQSVESRYLREVLHWVRGAGEEKLEGFLAERTTFREEMTHDQLIAKKFFDNGGDEYRITGYNAELVAYLARRFQSYDSRILSLGAGTLLLQRKLKRGIDNVDINHYMMEAGWVLAGKYGGEKITAKASSLKEEDFPDERYDLVDCAFVLHWSKAGSERVKILSQIHHPSRFTKPSTLLPYDLPLNSPSI